MKKIVIPILIVFLTFIIYKTNDDNLVDYMAIGDSISLGINSYGNHSYGFNDYLKSYLENNNLLHHYNSLYSKNDYKIEELINDIKTNKNILYDDKTYNIKKELREADLLIISIGMDELVNLLNANKEFNEIQNDLDKICNNMDNLIKEIVSLSKTKIILLGYYNYSNNFDKNTNQIFAYISDKYQSIASKYSITYIDIYEEIRQDKNYLPNKNDYHLTSKGYLKIANKIIKNIEDDF
ncbi:MAG: SGNH/GDSL hydrolase family protein [Bacilli bacterium]|nr:SGNH/GDSL hydrolase family protein [Bacilli bacterium]